MNYSIDNDRYFKPSERDSFPLIHITHNWDNLELILREGLKPNYCQEYLTNDKEIKEACFPMVCTSNVPTEFAIEYQRSYGTLGIVFDKKWGERNDFNPVLYLERRSDLTNDIIENFKNIVATSIDKLNDALNGVTIDAKSLMTKQQIKIFAHSKNYDGMLVRDGELLAEKYPFGMEREWRKIIQHDHAPYFLVGENINKKKDFSKLLSEVRVDYVLEELKGIIVETEYQVESAKETIMAKFKLDKFPDSIKVTINNARHIPDEG